MQFDLSQQDIGAFPAMILAWSTDFLPRLVTAVLIFALGMFIARSLRRAIQGVLERSGQVDVTIRPVISSAVYYGAVVLVLVLTLGQLGVQTASLLAIVGAAGLAIGLSLQGTLTNIAAGIMLLWLRPFRVGDYIEVANQNLAGTVREIGLFVCQLETFDGIYLFAPNATIWNFALRNHSRSNRRLVGVSVTLAPGTDLGKAIEIIRKRISGLPQVLKSPEPSLFVDAVTADGSVITARLWSQHADFGVLQRIVHQAIIDALGSAGMEMPAPPRTLRIVPADTDPSRLILVDKSKPTDSIV